MTKFTFTLKDVNIYDIENKYGISTLAFSTTKISNLASTPITTQNHTFVDETMQTHSCVISMSNLLNTELPYSTNISCFWCRHPFANPPIGCPVEYIPSIFFKKYYSEQSKDSYSIKGSITPQIQQMLRNSDQIDEKNYYITDGIFCSFNCCLAFIRDVDNYLYSQSENLLLQYFHTFFNQNILVNPAPSWRLLNTYGGHLSIEKFRSDFNTVTFHELNETVKHIPRSKSLGFLFEKKIKF